MATDYIRDECGHSAELLMFQWCGVIEPGLSRYLSGCLWNSPDCLERHLQPILDCHLKADQDVL